jgi:signal transduction histidine kinase
MLRARAAESGVELTVDMDADLPGVIGDVSLIRQMLNNLVGNAIKFSGRPDGQVRIHGERLANGALALDVTDNGAGLTAEQIPLALAAFGQVHDRAAVDERGSGLGLPLTRALIELHGGTLAMTSEPGHGTTVRLVFPASRVGCLMDGDGI